MKIAVIAVTGVLLLAAGCGGESGPPGAGGGRAEGPSAERFRAESGQGDRTSRGTRPGSDGMPECVRRFGVPRQRDEVAKCAEKLRQRRQEPSPRTSGTPR